jgi:hypothetical protein
MRPIGGVEANGEVEQLDCDPPGYIDGEKDRGRDAEAPKPVPLFASIPDLGVGLPKKNPFVQPR